MQKIFFTADFHLSHKNIINYCNRPFSSVEEMNKTILDNFFTTVGDKSFVYFLGDLSFRKDDFIHFIDEIQKRDIRLIFIKGNHDPSKISFFNFGIEPYDFLEIKIEDISITLCHYAMRTWNKSHYGAWNLHGHSHGTLTPFPHQYDVGVDNNNFYPVSFSKMKQIMKEGEETLKWPTDLE